MVWYNAGRELFRAPAHDTQEVDIPLDLTLVHNWLKFATDTSNPVKNYGVALIPSNVSTTIKAFYSANQPSGSTNAAYEPLLQITFSSNHDTLKTSSAQTVFFTNGTLTQVPGSIKILSGVGYDEIIKFDFSKFSSSYIMNNAELILSFDSPNSIYTNQTNQYSQNILSYMLIDTLHNYSLVPADQTNANISNYQLLLHVTSPFQKWARGVANYGLILKGLSYNMNLDQFAFFNENASDHTKRPHVIIRYSLRVP